MSDFIQLEYLQEKLQQLLAESLFAIYLYGSAVDGGLGPESDLDVLVVVTQPLTSALRAACTRITKNFTACWGITKTIRSYYFIKRRDSGWKLSFKL